MSASAKPLLDALDERIDGMLDACTSCGRCVEVCPSPATAGVTLASPADVISSLKQTLRSGAELAPVDSEAAEQWAAVCCGSGYCIKACPEQLNPRFLLTMVRRAAMKRDVDMSERRELGRKNFKKMSRGVRVLSRMQLSPDVLARLNSAPSKSREVPPDIVFYTGCNLLKTPHIGLLCLDVFDRLGVDYDVQGGPASCCGIFQTRSGDDENALRQGERTLSRFEETKTSEVVTWCPTCQIQFGEAMLPVQKKVSAPSFDLTMFPIYLASRLDELKPHFKQAVNRRIALHEHPGSHGVTEAVLTLLNAIPGVEIVDLRSPRIGYTLNALGSLGGQQRNLLANELEAAEAAGVDTLVGIFHSDHRELSAHEQDWPFEIINYMEVIGEAMGLHHDDLFKRMKTLRDVDAIIEECADMMATHGLDLDEAREVILADVINEQMLSPRRTEHPHAPELIPG